MRNVLVHRSGLADSRLIGACPWLQWRAGTPVRLVRNHFQLYGLALDWYILEIASRFERKWDNEGPRQEQIDLQDLLHENIRELLSSRASEVACVAAKK